MLKRTNPLVKEFKHVGELDDTILAEKKFVLTATGRPAGSHERSYNLPVADEIALVSLNDPMGPQDIRVYPRAPEEGEPKFQTVPYLNKNYDPLHYVLLFPCGDKDGIQV